jgi:hypothetical protein
VSECDHPAINLQLPCDHLAITLQGAIAGDLDLGSVRISRLEQRWIRQRCLNAFFRMLGTIL